MGKIKVVNTDKTLSSQDNETLLEALVREGVNIRSSCGGHAACNDCIIKILSGAENISPVTFEEKQYLGNVFFITKERLSCQTKCTNDETVEIEIVNLD